jgi:glucosamine 6-phosphate synthetase-like amidotransferase/phosphosugar isomerase protein
LIENYH